VAPASRPRAAPPPIGREPATPASARSSRLRAHRECLNNTSRSLGSRPRRPRGGFVTRAKALGLRAVRDHACSARSPRGNARRLLDMQISP
jgi:hypothetical protein